MPLGAARAFLLTRTDPFQPRIIEVPMPVFISPMVPALGYGVLRRSVGLYSPSARNIVGEVLWQRAQAYQASAACL